MLKIIDFHNIITIIATPAFESSTRLFVIRPCVYVGRGRLLHTNLSPRVDSSRNKMQQRWFCEQWLERYIAPQNAPFAFNVSFYSCLFAVLHQKVYFKNS